MAKLREEYIQAYAWADKVKEIISEYKDGDDSPLTPAEAEVLANHIRHKINLIEGNITPTQYEKMDGTVYIPAKNLYIPDWLDENIQIGAYVEWAQGYKLGAVKLLVGIAKEKNDLAFKVKQAKRFIEELVSLNFDSDEFIPLTKNYIPAEYKQK